MPELDQFIVWAEGYGLDTCMSCLDSRMFESDRTEMAYLAAMEWHSSDNAAVELTRLRSDLAEADRRAGAAERERQSDRNDVVRLARVTAQMKDQWGVSQNISFDRVWDDALALQKQVRHLLDDLVTESISPDGFVSYTVQNSLTTTNLIAALKRLPTCWARG